MDQRGFHGGLVATSRASGAESFSIMLLVIAVPAEGHYFPAVVQEGLLGCRGRSPRLIRIVTVVRPPLSALKQCRRCGLKLPNRSLGPRASLIAQLRHTSEMSIDARCRMSCIQSMWQREGTHTAGPCFQTAGVSGRGLCCSTPSCHCRCL